MDDKIIVSVPRNESEMLQQFLMEINVPIELQNYKSPYLQYLVSKEYQNVISTKFENVKQWTSKEDASRNVVSVHYKLNPQLWQFCQQKGIRLERIKR